MEINLLLFPEVSKSIALLLFPYVKCNTAQQPPPPLRKSVNLNEDIFYDIPHTHPELHFSAMISETFVKLIT